jgi:hypothetical protein
MATDGNGRGAGWLGRIARLFPEPRSATEAA